MNNEHTHATIGFIFFCITIMVFIVSVTKNQTVSEYPYCAGKVKQEKVQICFKKESDLKLFLEGKTYINYQESKSNK